MLRAGILVFVIVSSALSSPLAVEKVETVAPVVHNVEQIPAQVAKTEAVQPVVSSPKTESPKVEPPKDEAPKDEAPKDETPKVEVPKVEAPKVEAPKVEAPKVPKPVGRSLQDDIYNDVARGGRVPVAETTSGEEQLIRKLNTRCAQKDTSSCVLLKMVTYFNRLMKKSSISLGETVEIERTSAVSVSAVDSESRALSGDSDEEKLTNLITDKLYNFARSRALRFKLLPGADLLISSVTAEDGSLSLSLSMDTGKGVEGRGKKNSILPAIAAAAAMKMGMIGVIAFKVLVLLVGKALILSKIAFLIAAIIGLKKLTSQMHHVTYEVVAQPHHTHHESHGHDSYSSGWGRSIQVLPYRAAGSMADAHNVAYRGQKPS